MDLDELVADYCCWQRNSEELLRENETLQKELKQLRKKSSLNLESTQAKEQEAAHLRSTVDKLHKILTQRCNFEEENRQLKSEIRSMKKSSTELENTHSHQMAEAMDNLNAIAETHKTEMASALQSVQLKSKEDMAAKEKELEEKVAEVKTLQREKAELERLRHTDTVRLRLEYDAKMLRLQKQQQQVRAQHTAQPSSNDIFRKKLQHVKMESEREIAHWKRKAEELERQLQSVSHASKKTRRM